MLTLSRGLAVEVAPMRAPLAGAAAAGWSLDLDIDCVRLRATTAGARFGAALAAQLPGEARARLALLEAWTGFAPGRDLARVVVRLPAEGAPWLRLVGLPAARVAERLAIGASSEAVPGGLAAWPLPQHPELRFVAIAADQAVVVRAGDLTAVAAASGALPLRPAHEIWAVDLVPGTAAGDWARLLRRLELRGNGEGALTLSAQAADGAAAAELARRWQALAALAAAPAARDLPAVQRLAPALSGATVLREQARLAILVRLPAADHLALVDALAARIAQRSGPAP